MWTIGRSQRVEEKKYRPIVRKIRYSLWFGLTRPESKADQSLKPGSTTLKFIDCGLTRPEPKARIYHTQVYSLWFDPTRA